MNALVFQKLLAIVLTVALGYVAARLGWLGRTAPDTEAGGDPARVLAGAAFYLFVPALLFRTTARLDMAHMPWRTVFAFFVPAIATLLGVYLWHKRRAGAGRSSPAAPAVNAIACTFGNSVQVGIPFAAALFGDAGLPIHIALVSLHALALLSVLTALVELDLARAGAGGHDRASRRRTLAQTARNTVIHPVVLPVLAGLGWNLAGGSLNPVIDETLATLATAVVPLCLVLIGVTLAAYDLRGRWRGALGIGAVKLLMLPAAVLVVARWGFGLQGVPLAVVVMLAAMPTGSNALIFAQRYGALQAEVTAATVLSTLGFALTAPLWLAVLAWI